jgi:xylulokinase
MPDLLLGVDVGTSSTKGALVRPDGRILSVATRQHDVSMPRPGWAEHNAADIWWDGFRSVSRELVDSIKQGAIAAVGVSGVGPCLLPTRADGEPLRPAILYGVDTRATAEIAYLNDTLGAELIRARCGSSLTAQAIGPKMLWLQRQEPDVWLRTRRWFMTNGYLAYRLTGEYVLDHNSASQAAPLYDTHEFGWIADWCNEIAPGLEWPRLIRSTELAGTVTRQACAETGLTEGTPVVIGSTDAWAEACGAGATKTGDVMVMYGSSMVLLGVVGAPPPTTDASNTVGVLPGVFAGQTNLVATLPTGGAVAEWVTQMTGAGHQALTDAARSTGPGAGGLIMLPYFAGLRTPQFDPSARGAILGLTMRHTRGHLYRAALESIGFAIRHNLEAMEALGGGVQRLVAVGGGTQGGLAVQIASDITRRTQDLPRDTIGASHGDAFLAGVGVKLVADAVSWNPTRSVVTPLAGDHDLYDELYACYRQTYVGLRDQTQVLASLQARLS